jgi:prolyl oligopeptidase
MNYSSQGEIVVDTLHGTTVADPYRWLEDRNSRETNAWIADQKMRYEDYFSPMPELAGLRAKVRRYLDREMFDQPAKVGDRYFYRRRRPAEEQPSIYTCDGLGSKEHLLVDPSIGGPFATVSIRQVSENGRLLAYSVKDGGESSETIRFVDVETAQTLTMQLERGYNWGLAFTRDDSGYYYSHDALGGKGEERSHEIRYFDFDTRSSSIVFTAARSSRSRLVLFFDEQNLGAAYVHEKGNEYGLDFFLANRSQDLTWHTVFLNRENGYFPFLKNGRIFAQSFQRDRNGEIVELTPNGSEVLVIVPASTLCMRGFCIVGNALYVSYVSGQQTLTHQWTLTGEFICALPAIEEHTIEPLPAYSAGSTSLFLQAESFTRPPVILEWEPGVGRYKEWREEDGFPASTRNSVRRLSYPSKGGVSVPLSILSSDIDSTNDPRPTVITAYGGFGVPILPRFSVLGALMVELGANFAVASIRGGSEFGEEWHEAARGRKRQVAIDDLVEAAVWLSVHQIACPGRLAIFGDCNGALLAAAAITQRPQLFGAALLIAPIFDMVRYEQFGNARKWAREYGTVDNPEDFRALFLYSPYHRIQCDIDYPSILIVCGDKDQQCDPAHSRKMAARLQGREAQIKPVVVDYSAERGHCPTLPLSVRIEALARRVAFLGRGLSIDLSGECQHD